MLALPEIGMTPSTTVHNCKMTSLCDWIEASLLFSDDEISKSDVVDALIENHTYSEQDFAKERVDQAWAVLHERMNSIKVPLDISITTNRISRSKKWTDFPAYGFCMSLACAQLYPSWRKTWPKKASTYGSHFEELSTEAISAIFSDWKVKRIGWAPNKPQKLRDIIDDLTKEINERPGAEIELHVTSHANELGLDIIAYKPHNDNHPACPIIMVQCAAGKNWDQKLKTPDLDLWQRVISFLPRPTPGFTMPFAFTSGDEFRTETVGMRGLFLERNRLLGAFSSNSKPVSTALSKKLLDWTRPLIKTLPSDNR